MPLKVRCTCGQMLKVPETRVGTSVRCPVCESRVVIPGEVPVAPPLAAKPAEVKQVKSTSTSQRSSATPSQIEDNPPRTSREKAQESSARTTDRNGSRPTQRDVKVRQQPESSASDSPPTRRPPPLPKPTVSFESADVPTTPKKTTPSKHGAQQTPAERSVAGDSLATPRAASPPVATPPIESRPAETAEKTPPEKTSAERTPAETKLPLPSPAPSKDDVQESDSTAPTPKPQGVVHSAARRTTVYWLAAAVLGIALVGCGLAIADAVLDAQQLRPRGMSNWAIAFLVFGVVHAAYAFYLFQLPDWSTLRVAAMVMVVSATIFAMLLAVLSLGGGNLPLAASLQLDEFPDQRPELLCLIMVALTGLVGYLLGRASRRWRRSDQLIATPGDFSASSETW